MLARSINLYKEAYRGLSPATWWLSFIMLINRSGTMVVPFMTIYLTSPSMGYSIGKAGIVMGLFGAGAILGGYLGGRLTDKVGFFSIQLITLAGGGLLFFVLGSVRSFELICIFTFLLSTVNEAFRPANATAISFYSTEKNRTRSYSLNRLAINLGWAVGGALGGVIASYNYQLLFVFDGCTNLAAAGILWLLLKKHARPNPPDRHGQADAKPRVSAYRDGIYISFIMLTVLFGACFFQMFSTLPAFFKNECNLSTRFIGLLMAINGLVITFIEMVLVFKLEGRRRSTFYISIGVFLCGLSYLFLNLFPIEHALAIVMILGITFGEILSMPFMNSFWISRSRAENRGQYAGLYTIAWAIAQTAGPVLGSFTAEEYGFSWLWWIVSGLCVLAAFGYVILHKFTAGS